MDALQLFTIWLSGRHIADSIGCKMSTCTQCRANSVDYRFVGDSNTNGGDPSRQSNNRGTYGKSTSASGSGKRSDAQENLPQGTFIFPQCATDTT